MLSLAVLSEILILASTSDRARDAVLRSGLHDPEVVRRVWMRARDISLQPTVHPLVFSLAIQLGVEYVVITCMVTLFVLMGLELEPSARLVATVLLALVAHFSSAFISMCVYRISGGTHSKTYAAAATVLKVAASNTSRKAPTSGLGFALCLSPIYIWAVFKQLPATADLIVSASPVYELDSFSRRALICAGPLAAVRLLSHVQFVQVADLQLGPTLADFVLLTVCATASAASVQRGLLAGQYQWQWRAFLTPLIPLTLVDLGIMAGAMDTNLLRWIARSAGYGASGVLGALAYIKYAAACADTSLAEERPPRSARPLTAVYVDAGHEAHPRRK